MKTKEELNALKNKVESLNRKLAELTDDEMKQVMGGDLQSWQWLLNDFSVQLNMVNTMEELERLCNYSKGVADRFLQNGYLTQDEYDNAIKNIDNAYINFQHSFEYN